MDNFPNAQAQEPGNAEKNEIVVLNTAFEAMLKKLSEAHAQLKAHSVELEMKVAERTEELVNREEKLKIAYNQLQVARYKELEALNDKR